MALQLADGAPVRDLDPFGEDLRQDWERYARDWSTSDPFFAMDDSAMPHLILGRWEHVRECFLHWQDFSTIAPDGPGYERHQALKGIQAITHVEGERHDVIRRLMQPTFGPRRIDAYRAGAERVVEALLDDIDERGEFDAVADFTAHLMTDMVMGEMLGLSREEMEPFNRRAELHELLMSVPPGGEDPPEYAQAVVDSVEVIENLITRREQGELGDDFVSLVLKASRAGGDAVDSPRRSATTSSCSPRPRLATQTTAAAALMLLCQNRGQRDKLFADPGLIPDAVEECLRVHPGGYFSFTRFATRDTAIGGRVGARGYAVSRGGRCRQPRSRPV